MIVRMINGVLVSGCMLFVLVFGWIPPGALERDAGETFSRVAKDMTTKAADVEVGRWHEFSTLDDEEFADGCLLMDSEESD